MLAGKGRLLVSRSRNSRGSFNCPHGAGHRLGPVGRCVDDSHSITFQILAERPVLPVSCTGWYAAPRGHAGFLYVSVYVTAGRGEAPHVVRNPEGPEQMVVLAHINRLGADAAVGAWIDLRATRTFPTLATAPPRPGDRALVAGYSAGHLTEAVLSTVPDCLHGYICFHSDHALRPGMSGAPILSLVAGQLIGILIGFLLTHNREDPHAIWATSSTALRTLIDLAVPEVLDADRAGRTLSPMFPLSPSRLQSQSRRDRSMPEWRPAALEKMVRILREDHRTKQGLNEERVQ